MFTYGYIREAAMARLDIDEVEAEAMQLLKRFYLFANEAMQAICSSKPKYQYIDVTVVEKYDPLVIVGSYFRLATDAEINWDVETQGTPDFIMADEIQLAEYYHALNIYELREVISPPDDFIAYANNQAYKIVKYAPSATERFEAELNGYSLPADGEKRVDAIVDNDFSYIGGNKLKFYKAGRYLIPAKFLWFKFTSSLSDKAEIDMPSDIFLTIPIYIASVCYQTDNLQKAQILRQEFEAALARCTSTNFMTINKIRSSW